MAKTPLLATVLLVAANVLLPLAIAVFGKGFFPYKPLLPGLAEYDAASAFGPPPAAPFDRVVFMVVDALRSDFVYSDGSGFAFTQELIRTGAAVPFTAHATSPTVTMPRIKAMTTGSIPSFLDVVLNVAEGDQSSSLAAQDTWLAQIKARPALSALALYGDDTWLKLFPGTFDRADGTSSFFVSDFTEVDHNVTRNIDAEMRRTDWGAVVLHYLGLDHIGHKGGPRSPHMVPKQREMDAIVATLYGHLETEPHLANTLLVLAGDHGMNDAGNHGASSPGETSPALVFIAPKLARSAIRATNPAPLAERDDFQYYRSVEQSDLAPTLGALLGFPAPQNSLGAFIPDFLALWPRARDQVHILMHNAHQIRRILAASFGDALFSEDALFSADAAAPAAVCASPASDVEELACAWQALLASAPAPGTTVDDDAHRLWVDAAVQWLRRAQAIMSSMASNYDVPKLGLGLGAAVAGLVLAVVAAWASTASAGPDTTGPTGPTRLSTRLSTAPFALVSVLYGVMMFASSYVEEEQHFWYWAASSWLALVGLRGLATPSAKGGSQGSQGSVVSVVVALAALRLVRAWNTTGQKHAGAPDVVKTFLQPNPALLWTLVAATYASIAYDLVRGLVSLQSQHAIATHPRRSTPQMRVTFSPSMLVSVPSVLLLVWSAFSFKLVFTYEDSPELVGSFARPLVHGILHLSELGAAASPTAAPATLVSRARLVFSGLGLAAAAAVYLIVMGRSSLTHSKTKILLPVYALLAVTQSRTANIPLFLLFGYVYRFLDRAVARRALHGPDLTTALVLLQYASFFAFGGTNAISSVDLSSAYNGIAGYTASAVGLLLFIGNWAGSIYWAVAVAVLFSQQRAVQAAQAGRANRTNTLWTHHAALLTVFAAASAVAIMAACTALRTHLFVWTVFSPKYLYSVAWTLGVHLAVNLGLGSLVYWLGTF